MTVILPASVSRLVLATQPWVSRLNTGKRPIQESSPPATLLHAAVLVRIMPETYYLLIHFEIIRYFFFFQILQKYFTWNKKYLIRNQIS